MINKVQSTENKEKVLNNLLDYQKKTGKAFVQLTLGSQAMQELTNKTNEELSKTLEENLTKNKKKDKNNNKK